MKKIPLILFMALGFEIVYSQSLEPAVIATSGSFYANGNNSVSWTIGECIPETFVNSDNKLTQGFQQGVYEINTVVDFTENGVTINLFPNPATDFINLEILQKDNKDYSYQLFDSNGKCLKNGKITAVKSQIDLIDVAGSTYILNVYASNQKTLKSFKIIKIN
ncbi:MAG: T9SS type A sorting domain-containing protein [Prolixibacteraceae bacterium]|nr:T9SS type A sorting domain-containing protein [Prolixibacteraceae bacterium]